MAFMSFAWIRDHYMCCWYVDGKSYHTATKWSSGTNSFPAPFDEKFHLILNVAVGGRWPGNPDATTRFPQAMLVDYVRVYQRKQIQ